VADWQRSQPISEGVVWMLSVQGAGEVANGVVMRAGEGGILC